MYARKKLYFFNKIKTLLKKISFALSYVCRKNDTRNIKKGI